VDSKESQMGLVGDKSFEITIILYIQGMEFEVIASELSRVNHYYIHFF
jgi:hypothetical protein